MYSRLEDALREKERELRLHRKFVDLSRFWEEEVFPPAGIPLKAHIETLGDVISRLIPEPKDRREELFSGELFALLCVIYFHDIGVVEKPDIGPVQELLPAMGATARSLWSSPEELKKFERFVEICLGASNVFLVALGARRSSSPGTGCSKALLE